MTVMNPITPVRRTCYREATPYEFLAAIEIEATVVTIRRPKLNTLHRSGRGVKLGASNARNEADRDLCCFTADDRTYSGVLGVGIVCSYLVGIPALAVC
jgi:hypothetical protein